MIQENSRVRTEVNILQSQLLHRLSRHLTKRMRHNIIIKTMCKEERSLLIRPVLRHEVLDPITQKQVARKTEDTTQLLLVCDTRENGHGTSLGKTTEDNPRGFDAVVDLLLDQGVEVFAGTEDAGFVLGANRFFEVELRTIESVSVPTIQRDSKETAHIATKLGKIIPTRHGHTKVLNPNYPLT